MGTYSGHAKLEFCDRLGTDWSRLADLLEVPHADQERIRSGDAVRNLWAWVERREELNALPEALDEIGRGDLARVLRDDLDQRRPAVLGNGERRPTLVDDLDAPPEAGPDHPPVPWMVLPTAQPDVPRPELTFQVVQQLLDAKSQTVGLTGVHGGGGFGKTTLARMACEHPDIRRKFTGGLLWIEIGQNRRGTDLSAAIADLCAQLTGEQIVFTSPGQAGYRLGELLAHRDPTLLVVDDVWEEGQLAPFLHGSGGVRLITTRISNLIPPDSGSVRVDEMTDEESRTLLLGDIPGVPTRTATELLRLTGKWALPMSMINGVLRRAHRHNEDVTWTATDLARRLREDGPATLDLGNERSRQKAIVATIEGTLAVLLRDNDRLCFLQLGIFPEDVDVSMTAVTHLWSSSASLSAAQARGLCEELAELSLLAAYLPGRSLRLHDVIRDYARHELGLAGRQQANAALLDSAARTLHGESHSGPRPWWTLPETDDYLWHELSFHLIEAGRLDELSALACDLRWADTKTLKFGAAEVDVDLSRADGPVARALRGALFRQAEFTGPMEPEHSRSDVLVSRLDHDPLLSSILEEYRSRLPAGVRRLRNVWAPPDVHLNPVRIIDADARPDSEIGMAPDGSWIAVASHDSAIRIWSSADRKVKSTLVDPPKRPEEIPKKDRWSPKTHPDLQSRPGRGRPIHSGHDLTGPGGDLGRGFPDRGTARPRRRGRDCRSRAGGIVGGRHRCPQHDRRSVGDRLRRQTADADRTHRTYHKTGSLE